ncbi:hypothetical protein PTTG_03453 [Puccinia triticina 1-1 BBBD Race 1]|uniref:Transcriptional coactivator hfi1/ADA1 n=2 Tax=Puccinia triticina TaxID=208348 RepID=A0A0C4ERN4_PUCT1|nr:uncharacterized protein PtA15_7A748 [Puccinia triticina]OAV96244.1 hypothetical protein PTTG_03453 [Puccinia triticina 1-1 BBBD Race 1]WAQ87019.1 hypothetical protein PtA15_7A748 [Puccinia triticina]
MLHPFTASVPTELYPPPPNKRADTLAIKQAIADALSEDDGRAYWASLVKFLTGKLDRTEFEAQTARLLQSESLVGLHNALILSILYNTTRPDPATTNPLKDPETPPTTGEGWHKRKRPPAPPVAPPKIKTKSVEKDPKKRKLKEAVMALGHRERNRLKQIASLKEEELVKLNAQQPLPRPLSACQYLYPERTENVMSTPLASKMKISSSTLYQDYMRCQQAPVCSESKQLPDFDTLKDRMSLIAYDSGLMNGVDKAASSLALIALEVHLKTLLGDLLSLIRSDRAVATPAECALSVDQTQPGEPHSQSHAEPPIASTSARPYSSPSDTLFRPDPASSPSKPVTVTTNQAFQTSSNLRLRDLKTQGLAPHLTSRDVAALAEISPHAFVRTHPAALERLIAVCSSGSDSSQTNSTTNGISNPEAHSDRIIQNNNHSNPNGNLAENYLLIEQKI